MKKQKVLNLFAGAGSGKSTLAAYIFANLKFLGYNVELVTEYAKELAWEGTLDEMLKVSPAYTQNKILEEQSSRLKRLYGEVDLIISDSPLLLNKFYGEGIKEKFRKNMILKRLHREMNKYDNYNVFVERCKPYNPKGRVQTEEEAIDSDLKIKSLTSDYLIEVKGTIQGAEECLRKIRFEIFKEEEDNFEKLREPCGCVGNSIEVNSQLGTHLKQLSLFT